jgi:CRISPR-associated endonuclease/helicase Cas3
MLFSCPVDANSLETEAFYDTAEGGETQRGGHLGIEELRDRLRVHMARINGQYDDIVSRMRSRSLAASMTKTAAAPGLFTPTVPTGSGKISVSLTFALGHAAQHGLRRVTHAAPIKLSLSRPPQSFARRSARPGTSLEHHALAECRDQTANEAGGASLIRLAAEIGTCLWWPPRQCSSSSLFACRTSRRSSERAPRRRPPRTARLQRLATRECGQLMLSWAVFLPMDTGGDQACFVIRQASLTLNAASCNPRRCRGMRCF